MCNVVWHGTSMHGRTCIVVGGGGGGSMRGECKGIGAQPIEMLSFFLSVQKSYLYIYTKSLQPNEMSFSQIMFHSRLYICSSYPIKMVEDKGSTLFNSKDLFTNLHFEWQTENFFLFLFPVFSVLGFQCAVPKLYLQVYADESIERRRRGSEISPRDLFQLAAFTWRPVQVRRGNQIVTVTLKGIRDLNLLPLIHISLDIQLVYFYCNLFKWSVLQ